ncbi:Ribonuclease P protein component [Candidatus Similichlamydia laticola]|uniref:Ribonuclease P protein component n=2 Tax=Candidatus Similichlamydia laticola TaxID=2170265 RepID=A0A369KDR6_9BACT|nr:Ribonuclease P protein component [Candidatus Similichlamydia laticola]
MRILKRRVFLKIGRFGRRFHGEALCFSFVPGSCLRLGITVSKKYGDAVKRNQCKRRIRELFRLYQHRFPSPLSLSVTPKVRQSPLTYCDLENDFEHFLRFLLNKSKGNGAC